MKRVAVTGGSGHVGANLVRECIRERYNVRALVREDRRAFEGLDVELVEGDLLDRESLQELCGAADSVYHLAACISADLCGRRGECYLLSGHWAGPAELAGLITKITGKRTKGFVIPIRLALFVSCFNAAVHRIRRKHTKFTPFSIKSLLSHRYISHQKATNVLGYTHRNFEETVRDTLAWFEKAGMLEEGWINGRNFESTTVPGR